MTSHGDRLLSILQGEQAQQPQPRRRSLPKGVEPGLRIDPRSGEGTVGAVVDGDHDPTWDDELRFLGVDPADYEVHGPYLEVRSWDAPVGEGKVKRLRYVKAKIRPRTSGQLDGGELAAWLRKARPPRRQAPIETGRADVLCASDWQIGKAGEHGGGTPETVDRVVDMVGRMQDRVRDQRKLGRRAETLHLAGMGDLLERCAGHYAAQLFTVDLNEREQKRVARWLLAKVLRELAPLYDRVVAASVASNHGQNNRNGSGKQQTTPDDDADLELFEHLAELAAENPDAFGHVNVVQSPDPLVWSVDIMGTGVAFTHSHQTKGGTSRPIYKLWDWWTQRAGSVPPLSGGDCQTLVTAHYHHHFQLRQQGKTLLGCPALDGGSRWLSDSAGVWSDPGTLVFTVAGDSDTPQDVGLL